MKKYLLVGGAIVLILVALGVVLLVGNLNNLVRKAIVEGLTYILEVDVSLQSIDLSIQEGKVELHGLRIGNPEGFKTPEAFSAGRIVVQADLASFRTEQPTIQNIEIDRLQVTLEQGMGSSNLGKLTENASRFQGGQETKEEKPAASEGEKAAQKKIVIDRVAIQDAKVGLSAPLLQGKAVSFSIPQMELKDIGKKGDGATAAEAIALLVREILAQAIRAGGNLIPADLAGMLSKSLGGAMEGIGNVGGALGEQTGEAGKAAGDTLKGAAESIGGMFKKKD